MSNLLPTLLCAFACLLFSKCNIQDIQSNQNKSEGALSELDLKLARANLQYDTSIIAILDDSTSLYETQYHYKRYPYLTQEDLFIIDSLLKEAVYAYNKRKTEPYS